MARQKGQETRSMMDTFDQYGFFPSTVERIEERPDGWTFITIDPDPDSDILSFHDDSPAIKRGMKDAGEE